MSRPNTPWYRSVRDCWYVKLNGRTTSLKVKGKQNQQAALVAFGELRAKVRGQPTATVTFTVSDLLDQFISDVKLRLKPSTVKCYWRDTDSLRRKWGTVAASALTPQHLKEWLAGLTVPSSTSRSIMLSSVSAALGWAVKEDLIDRNPALKVPKPKSRRRTSEALISPEEHQKLLAAASVCFRDVLVVLEATGCRPSEVASITAQNFFPDAEAVVLTEHKTDRTGKPRVVFLPAEVVELLMAKAAKYPTGPLLRTYAGRGWTGTSISFGMRDTKKKIVGGSKAIAYGYRHTFVTDALAGGVPTALVAELVGHSGTAVIDKHYSHLGVKADVLRAALRFRRPVQTKTTTANAVAVSEWDGPT